MKRSKFGIILICVVAAVIMVIVLNTGGNKKNNETDGQEYAKILSEKETAGRSKAKNILNDIENDKINENECAEIINDCYEEFVSGFERLKELSVDEQVRMVYDAAVFFNMSYQVSQKDDTGELKKTKLYSFSKDSHYFITEYTLKIDERKGKHPKGLSDEIKNFKQKSIVKLVI